MGVDDRPTDRQPHAHAAGLRREEGVEEAVHCFRSEPRTRILDRNEQIAGPVDLRSYPQHPRLAHDRAHRLDAIHDQIEDDLLQLNPVAHDGFETAR